jgi:iron complex outermembrane receptor protein
MTPSILLRLTALNTAVILAFPAQGSASAGDESEGLAEITVTAQRRSENIEKVPLSMTALSNNMLEDLHIENFSDLSSLVPGLTLSTPGGSYQSENDIAIRGIFSGGNSPTTAVYIDETPITIRRIDLAAISGSPEPDIFDLDRIEVLRGPQGTLFGSSAMGGAIRFITPQPSLNESSGFAKAEYSYTDRGDPSYGVGLAYGMPIVQDVVGFRVSGWYHVDGGFVDIENPYNGDTVKRNSNTALTYVFRPALTVSPLDGLTITAAAFVQHHHTDAPNTYWATLLPNLESGAHVNGDLLPQPANDHLGVYSLSVKYDMSFAIFQSDTSFLDRQYKDDDDWTHWYPAIFGGGPFSIPKGQFSSYETNLISTRAWQQEFRLTSRDSGSRFGWVAGLFYRHAKQISSQPITSDLTPMTQALFGLTSLEYFGVPNFIYNGQVLNSYTFFSTLDESKAVFGEINYELLAGLKLNVGVRYEHAVVRDQRQINAGPLLGLTFSDETAPDQVQNPITPRAGLTYQYTDRDMAYITASKGYRSGGSNAADATQNALCLPAAQGYGLSSVPTSYDADSLWSYELGAKDSFFDRRLVTQASVYYVNWTNIQTPLSLNSCAETITVNRGKAISRGFDFQVQALPFEGMKVLANVGYTDAFYPYAAYGGLQDSGLRPLLNAAGDKLREVVPWSASIDAEYSHPIGAIWDSARAYIRADYRWLDSPTKGNPETANYDPDVDPYPNPAYGILNLRLGVVHEGLDISLFVDNATNSDPRLGYSHVVPGDPLYQAQALRPLAFGVTTRYRF